MLEFLLSNHPSDCPVCDKGGECPLQDLTFRYGPGVTRMTLPKRTHDKPVPVSPLIKLDRERCILCYRCTRFSESVSGDMQLVTENRGAHSMITTFEGRPYTNEFSGNVTELCPVGALTSTTYRFKARPWEIQNVPTVCTGCAVGCNISASIREGHVVRVLSRNHPEVDEGWLCDRGRYALGQLRAPDRVTSALIRGGRGLEPVVQGDALEHVSERLRTTAAKFGAGSIAVLSSGTQTNEESHLWARILAEGLAGGISVCGPDGHSGLDTLAPYLASISDLDTAAAIVVAGDTELSQRAPVVELRIRKAVTGGAKVITVGVGGTRLETLRGAHHISTSAGHRARNPDDRNRSGLRAGRCAGGGRAGGADLERPRQPGGGRHPRPSRPQPRRPGLDHPRRQRVGRPRGWPGHALPQRGAGGGRVGPDQGDRAAGSRPGGRLDERRALARCAGAGPVRAPGDGISERFLGLGDHHRARLGEPRAGGHRHQPRGPRTTLAGSGHAARPACRTATTGRQSWASGSAWKSASDAAQAFIELAQSRTAFAGMSWSSLGERAELPERPQASSTPAEPRLAGDAGAPQGTMLVAYRELISGTAADRSPELHFQKRVGIEINHDDAEAMGVATGDRITVSLTAAPHPARQSPPGGCGPAPCGMAQRVPYVGPATVAADPAEEPADA